MKNISRSWLVPGLAVASLVLAVGSARAADSPSTAEVLGKLHQSNQKEIEAGKVAQKNGKSAKVKDYGRMLEKDHGAADKKVMALAKEKNVDLAVIAPPRGHDMAMMAAGPDFDLKFGQDMLDDHKKDIAEATNARDTTSDPQLKKLLNELIPTLQKHEQVAQQIVDSGGKK